MAIDETVSHGPRMYAGRNFPTLDISCLYAATRFSQYITIKQPEVPKGAVAIGKIEEILKAKSAEVVGKLGEIIPLLEQLENENPSECEKRLEGLTSETYRGIKSEVESTYQTLKSSGSLDEDEENVFKSFLQDFNKDGAQMFMYNAIHEGESAEEDNPMLQQLQESRQKYEEAHTKYLASAEINTPEGRAAWQIAHFGGLHFRRATRDGDKGTITVNKTDLETHLEIAVADGLQCARETALIENPAELETKAKKWLSTEMNNRLSQGLEFNLFDAVSVRKGDDGFIYIRDDEREPYTVE